jgi:hypothetical protein
MSKNVSKVKKTASFFAYVLLIVLSAITLTNAGGFFRTIPFVLVLPALATFLYNKRELTSALTFLATFMVASAQSLDIKKAFLLSVAAFIFSFAGIYIKRLLITAYVCDGKARKIFCIILACAFLLIGSAVYFTLFGNPVSALVSRADNIAYIKENYPERELEINETVYDFSHRRYFTNVSFMSDSPMNADISVKGGVIIDGYHNYYEYKYMSKRAQELSLIIYEAFRENTSVGCNIAKTDILFAPNKTAGETYSDMVFDIYFGTQTADESTFAGKCKEYCEAINEKGFEYGALKFYGGYAGEFYYEMTVPHDFPTDFYGNVLPFNEKHLVKRETEADYKEHWDFGR